MKNKRDFNMAEFICCSVTSCTKKAKFINWFDTPKIKDKGFIFHCPMLLCEKHMTLYKEIKNE